LPIQTFKVGVLGPCGGTAAANPFSSAGEEDILDVQREVTISRAVALATAGDSGHEVGPHEALYAGRVEGLQADAQYRFVLGSSNAVGTGRWSRPSSLVRTPVAAPPAPINVVATVTVDEEQRVMVNVSWECGHACAGSGPIAAFHVSLLPGVAVALSGAQPSAIGKGTARPKEIHERVAALGTRAGLRVPWRAALSTPGHYSVKVVAESTAGQQSSPTVLALEVHPEAFPAQEPVPDVPQWAEEPVLVLGPAGQEGGVQRFAQLDDAGNWLQALLLWHDGSPRLATGAGGGGPASSSSSAGASGPGSGKKLPGSTAAARPVDVICSYRRPGSGQSYVGLLAASITSSRLQVALPSHVPMSLRLVLRPECAPGDSKGDAGVLAASRRAKVKSEPLLMLLSEGSEYLKAVWDLWSRQAPNGQPPQWSPLPEDLQTIVEAAWLEGQAKVQFELRGDARSEGANAALAPGRYEMTFGDDRQTQHTVQRLGPGGWHAKARRTIRDSNDEDALASAAVASEDQCIICMERRRTHAFMHAETGDGHLAVCGACAETFRTASAGGGNRAARSCPVCRRPFTAVHRIYS
jgi:uncharacterized CHY-type Zn-finger protein